MVTFMIILITIVSVVLIFAVLIQNPKGGGLDSTFGGNNMNQIFGAARSADFIEKATWVLVAVLIGLCIATTLLVQSSGGQQLLSQ